MQQQETVPFYSSATTTAATATEDGIDAAMTSAVTSLISHSSLQQLAASTTTTPTPIPAATSQTNIGQTQQKRKQVKNACSKFIIIVY